MCRVQRTMLTSISLGEQINKIAVIGMNIAMTFHRSCQFRGNNFDIFINTVITGLVLVS